MIKKIYICEEITENTVNRIKNYITKSQFDIDKIDKIYIYINSKGGSIEATQKLIALFTPYQSKITTVALEYCQSAATLIFLFGNKRLVKNSCEFLMHRPSFNFKVLIDDNINFTLPAAKLLTKKLKQTENYIIKFYKKHHVPKKLIIRTFYFNNYNLIISVKDLINYNMATEFFYNNQAVFLYDKVIYNSCHTSNK